MNFKKWRESGIILCIFVLLFGVLGAETIKTEGYGRTEEIAKAAARTKLYKIIAGGILADMTNELNLTKYYAKWKNRSEDFQEIKKKIEEKKFIADIKGEEYVVKKSRGEYLATCNYKKENVKIYESNLNNIKLEIEKMVQEIENKETNNEKNKLCNDILNKLDQFYKNEIMAESLRSEAIPDIGICKNDIREKMKFFDENFDNLQEGLKRIKEEIKPDKVFIGEIINEETNETTAFSNKIKENMLRLFECVSDSENAKITLKTVYKPIKTGVEIRVKAYEGNEPKPVKNISKKFLPLVYKGIDIDTPLINFTEELENNKSESEELKIEIDSSQIKNIMKKGETFRLSLKTSKKADIIAIIHSAEKKFSYLLTFSENEDNGKFIYKMIEQEVNKKIELGEYEISSAFGIEYIHIIASTEDLSGKIPANMMNDKEKLYILEEEPEKALSSLRKMIKELKKNKKAAISEKIIEVATVSK